MASSSSSSSSSSSVVLGRKEWTYDVFLSFRGRDTRHSFVDHLYAELVRNGIRVFKDDEMLGGGQSILEEHVKAIKESRFAVVVFSENYANSSLCLEELSTIMECHAQMAQRVLPVFYHVDPFDVLNQNGDFATAFETHEHMFKGEMDKVKKWRDALTAAASLSGLQILPDKGGEAAFIRKIVVKILVDLQPRGATWENHLIGIEPHIDAIVSFLKMEATEEVRIVGIWGMGGIGKTTIAQALFDRTAHKFERSSFFKDVRENSSSEKDICALQQKILEDILGERHGYKIETRDEGAKIIQERCCRKKVLLVLDDVNDVEQLEFLAATPAKWFGPGSRIIITTRDQHLLSYANANDIYRPALLHTDQALELFSRHAFRRSSPPDGYEELSIRTIHLAGGLPLALKILGSFLCGREASVWGSALDTLAKTPGGEIYDTLKISYDHLNGFEQQIFLDIACFYKGHDVQHVTRILESYGFDPVIGINALIGKSLITVSSNNRLDMHDLIQEMGWKVVHDSAPNSRLWTYDVFLSFSARDTLHSFVDSLYAELVRNGLHVFKDDEMFGGGQTILEQHVKAIKESRFAVVVFSNNYANSSLCLKELSMIMECHDQMGQRVLPVFYHVDPIDVRKQNGDFATAFQTHEHKFKGEMDKVNKWRDALSAAANLACQHILPDNGGEAAFISNIFEEISAHIQPPGARRENHLIGIEPRIDALYSSVVQTSKGGWTYDVFLSFSARDTGNNFSDHLYNALFKEPIRVFKHGYAGQTISEDVVKAIKESRFAVVVFSKNYAKSSLCLEELSKIMECHKQMLGYKVLPVFYHVDQSDLCVQEQWRILKYITWAWKSLPWYERAYATVQEGEVDDLTAATNLPGLIRIPPDNMGESAFINKIVQRILADVEIRERKIGNLFLSDKEIGQGSNGTIVFEGMYDIRRAAVKRIVKEHHDVAKKEIQNLIDSDRHPNIVRYYGVEYGKNFIYIALELCVCSLHKLILPPKNPTVELQQLILEFESFKLPNRHPSPELLKVMRDTVAGLAHLHELKIIHRDLKPQNVLISKDGSISAKVSDMGISKRLPANKSSLTSATGYGSSGWQAPETLRKERQTHAVDLFSLGGLLFFCITGGEHPFGDDVHERDTNIKNDRKDLSLVVDNPEAFDLVSNLLHPDPKFRPTAAEAYHHPLFWDAKKRLSFFHAAYDRLKLKDPKTGSDQPLEENEKKTGSDQPLEEKEKKTGSDQPLEENEKKTDSNQPLEEKEKKTDSDRPLKEKKGKKTDSKLLEALERIGIIALGGPVWNTKLDSNLRAVIEPDENKPGKKKPHSNYKYGSVRDLLKFIRDKKEHYPELPEAFQLLVHKLNKQYCGKEVNKSTSYTSIQDNIVGYEWYFRETFPKLLIQVYKVLKEHCGEETGLQDYFRKTLE